MSSSIDATFPADNDDAGKPLHPAKSGFRSNFAAAKSEIEALQAGTSLEAESVVTAAIAANAVTNAKLDQMAQATVKGRAAAAGTGDPVDLTPAQMRVLIDQNADEVSFTPANGLSQITVQGAIEELDLEKAPLASPELTGTPTAPTAALGTNTTQIATMAAIQAAVADLIGGAPGALDTLNELAAALNDDSVFSTTVTNALALKLAIANNLSDVNNAATAFGNIKQAATTSATGVVELAIASEVNTGTDATRAVTPDALAGSNLGTAIVEIEAFSNSTATAVGDDAADGYFRIPSQLNGMNLVSVAAHVGTAGTTGTTDVQIARIRSGTPADMLTTKITIDSTETDTSTAATSAVINTANDDVATGDKIRIDVDAISTTPASGLVVTLVFQLP